GRVAVLSAAPHGAAAAMVDSVMAEIEGAGGRAFVVDLSADFRYGSAAEYAAVYGQAHGAPGRLGEFRCAVPEMAARDGSFAGIQCMGHPGCFTTAVVLAAAPLL